MQEIMIKMAVFLRTREDGWKGPGSAQPQTASGVTVGGCTLVSHARVHPGVIDPDGECGVREVGRHLLPGHQDRSRETHHPAADFQSSEPSSGIRDLAVPQPHGIDPSVSQLERTGLRKMAPLIRNLRGWLVLVSQSPGHTFSPHISHTLHS